MPLSNYSLQSITIKSGNILDAYSLRNLAQQPTTPSKAISPAEQPMDHESCASTHKLIFMPFELPGPNHHLLTIGATRRLHRKKLVTTTLFLIYKWIDGIISPIRVAIPP